MADQEKNGKVAVAEKAPPRLPERTPLGMFDQMEREFAEMRRRMALWFRRPESPLFEQPLLQETAWAPTADAYEKDGMLVVKAELPGVQKNDIAINVDGGMLTVEGSRTEEKETKDARFYSSERFSGSFTRSFALPDGVDTAAITATFKDGLLEVRVPLPAEAKGPPVRVAIDG